MIFYSKQFSKFCTYLGNIPTFRFGKEVVLTGTNPGCVRRITAIVQEQIPLGYVTEIWWQRWDITNSITLFLTHNLDLFRITLTETWIAHEGWMSTCLL